MKYRLFLLAVLLIVNIACVQSAIIPAITSTPRVTASPAPLTKTPTVDNRLYKVSTDVLEVRRAPGEKSLNVGYLGKGDIVTVFETKKTTSEKCLTWARIGSARWVCMDRLSKVTNEH